MKAFKKVAVIGLDCALTHMLDKHIAEGLLPNFKKFFENGTVCDNALVPFPTITPPNWATLCTGAWPGTHGVTDFCVHEPDTTPTALNALCAFNSKWIKAETIWEAAEKAGKKSIVFNYPGAAPSKLKNGIVVGGRGLAIGMVFDGNRLLDKDLILSGEMLFSTGREYNSVYTQFVDAKDWTGVDSFGDDPLEATVVPNFPNNKLSTFAPVTWHILVRDSEGKGYDTATLSPTKDMKDAFFTVKTGEWTPKLFTHITADGVAQEVFFNAKLLRLSDDAEDFSLFLNPLVTTHGWATPPEVDDEIRDVPGCLGNAAGYIVYSSGWIDADTWIEINHQHANYNAAVAMRLLKQHEWDIFYMHHHPPDWTYHLLMTDLDENTAKSKEAYELAWRMHREMCIATDKMIGDILTTVGDDTCVVLVSDHGAVMDGPAVSPNDILEQAGLMTILSYAEVDSRGETKSAAALKKRYSGKVDVANSKALAQRTCHLYVNLKGRYPGGIVEPEDYEKVQQQIIDALYAYKHPETGERCISLAISRKDARMIGLHGDEIGDVIYAIKPEYGSQHGNILPTATWGVGSLHALMVFHGPGIKAQRMQRTCNIVDLVPTLCYGAELPVPIQCEGSVLYQIFDNPNFKLNS